MNKIYRLIWSRSREMWMAVSEKVAAGWFGRPLTVGILALAALLATGGMARALDPNALPTGGQIVAGQGSIAQSGNAMTVNQSTDKMIAHWNSFNIGQNASVAFQQPGAASVALNRILDQNPSQIFGSLTANGQVFLLNPAGVYFGPTARVDVGGLVASSLNLSNENFLAGRYRFGGAIPPGEGWEAAGGAITNAGTIRTAAGGYVAFLSPAISNNGTIAAPAGTVALAAGDRASLDFTGDRLVSFTVDQGAVDAQIANRGLIQADGGLVLLTARAANELTTAVVNNEGVIEAKGLDSKGGRIVLTGGLVAQTGTLAASGAAGGEVSVSAAHLLNAGSISVDGREGAGGDLLLAADRIVQTEAARLAAGGATAGGRISLLAGDGEYDGIFSSAAMVAAGDRGGDITLAGRRIDLRGATLDAAGITAGGSIRVGGDLQGSAWHDPITGRALANAAITDVSPGNSLDASATQGDGGRVIVWSDHETSFAGSAAATAQGPGHQGGFIEISSGEHLRYGGSVDASSPQGPAGTVLFDPKNITIEDVSVGTTYTPFVNPNPGADSQFGTAITALANGNMVVTDEYASIGGQAHAGAVYLFKPDGTLVSSLTGSHANDQVGFDQDNWNGGAVALSNGNFVVSSPAWNESRGAVTWGSGTTGVSGVVSSANSLVGSTPGDWVGGNNTYWNGVVALTNGNYVVASHDWNNGAATKAGAATWVDGSTGLTANGVNTISSANSLVGTRTDDGVGSKLTALTNGNYVVASHVWDNGALANAGAATWVDGGTGLTADGVNTISSANSLVGGRANDNIGVGGVSALSNGNYVVSSFYWHNESDTQVGAATWVNGATGQTMNGLNAVSAANSIVGSTLYDNIGMNNGDAVTALTNGNYVVVSRYWDNGALADAGAATWGSGATGTAGVVSSANSLVGTKANDDVGGAGAVALTNGNYVVLSPYWNNDAVADAGAVTWGNGATGTTGAVSAANSLVGSAPMDFASTTLVPLTDGNYVFASTWWGGFKGMAAWGDGSTGGTRLTGTVSEANALVGTRAGTQQWPGSATATTGDMVGYGVTALTNGNYVVTSPNWTNGGAGIGIGAATWGNGATGVKGTISAANSLLGSQSHDYLGNGGVTPLTNGNYVVSSYNWSNGATTKVGAVTWADGTAGLIGTVSAANSLVGSTAEDRVGYGGVTALDNGNYVVGSTEWDHGATADTGAVTWADGATGLTGTIGAENSLIGTAGQKLGYYPIAGSGNVFSTMEGVTYGGAGVYAVSSGSPYGGGYAFGDNASQSASITPTQVTDVLNTGSNLVLQANNDLTLSAALTVNNAAGNGGALMMQAGRSILLNESITTDNGDLTLIANETAAAGVVEAHRDAGAAVITQAAGKTIQAGSGAVSITLKDGAGKTHSESGAITLRGITAGSLAVANQGATAGSGIVLNGDVVLSGTLTLAAAAGDITQGGGTLTVGGTTSVTAGANDVTLDRAGNDFTGAVSVVSGKAVSLKDANGLTLGNLNVSGDLAAQALSGDLTLAGSITKNSGDDATATLTAGNSIVLEQAIRNTGGDGKLDVMLDADNADGVRDGDGIILLRNDIATGGGDLRFGTGATIAINGVTTPVGGDVYAAGSGARSITTGGGNVTVNGEMIIANPDGLAIDTGGGDMTFGGQINSGNAYTGVSYAGKTWSEALAHAASGSGLNTGDTYLATLTTRLENALASRANGYNPGWLGARRITGIGSNLTWRWVTGPEGAMDGGQGLAFFTQNTQAGRVTDAQNGTPVAGAYSNWNNGEPNNWNGAAPAADHTEYESVMQFTGNLGKWNDLPGGPLVPVVAHTQDTYVKETNLAASPLSVNAGAGAVTFSGAVGNSKALAALAVTSTGGIAIDGGAVTTEGLQTYTGNVTLGSAGTALTQTAAGTDFTLQAGKSITNATGADAGLTIKTTGSILLETGSSIGSGAGKLDTVLWSDSDATNGGRIALASGSSIATHGGHLAMTGGSGSESWNGLAVGAGYAQAIAGSENHGVFIDSATVATNGGNVLVRGRSHTGASKTDGVRISGLTGAALVDSGTGTIAITGVNVSSQSGDYNAGVRINEPTASTIRSANTTAAAITITGDASGFTGASSNVDGVIIEDNHAVIASGAGGGVTITGTGDSGQGQGVRLRPDASVLANGGDIAITGIGGETAIKGADPAGGAAIGYKAGTLVTSSSSNITLTGDTLALSGNDRIQSSGSLTIQPYSAGATIGIAGGTGTLQLASGYFSTNFTDGFSGITVGKSDAGLISVGGSALSYNDPLTLKTGNSIFFGTTSAVTGNNNALTLWTRAGGNDVANDGVNGSVWMPVGSSVDTGGGQITIGGGSDPTVGYALGDVGAGSDESNARYRGVTINGTLNAGGGNVSILGRGGNAGNARGVSIGGAVGTSGDGSITVKGVAKGVSDGLALGDTALAGSSVGTLTAQNGNISLYGTKDTGSNGINLSTAGSGIATSGTGSLAMTATGHINGTGTVAVGGATTLTAGVANITLANGANDFAGAVSVVSGNNVSLRDTNALDLGASTVSGNLTLQSGGALTQSGNLAVTGTTSVTAGTYNVTLDRAGNTFTGAVSIVSGGTVSLKDADALTLGAATVSGSLTVEALGGDLTIAGNITKDSGDDAAATFKAARHLVQNSGVGISSSANKLHVVLNSDSDATDGGGIYLLSGAGIDSNGGDILLGGGAAAAGYATGTGLANRGTGDAWFNEGLNNKTYGIALENAAISSGAGSITFRGKGAPTTSTLANGIIIGRGSVVQSTSGAIDLTGYSGGSDGHAATGFFIGTDAQDPTGNVATVKSQSGTVSITGIAGPSGAFDRPHNIAIATQGLIESTSGDITIIGNTRENLAGGIALTGGIVRSNGSAAITLNGAGEGPENWQEGIELSNNSAVVGGAGDVTLIAAATGGSRPIKYVSGTISGTGNLLIKPGTASEAIGIGDGTTSAADDFLLSTAFLNALADGFSGITIGRPDGTGKITAGAFTVNDDLTLLNSTGGIELTGLLGAGGNTVTLNSTGSVTDTGSGAITAANLALLGAGGSFTLDAAGNDVGTLAADTGSLTYLDSNALTIGTVNPTGITATGPVSISTLSGDLTVSQNITTTDASNAAIILNAGKSAAAGAAAGGEIILSGSPTLSTGAGGRVTFYTGSLAGSTGLAESSPGAGDGLIAFGSGRFRYHSDEETTNYTTVLGAGAYAIYRQQPTIFVTPGSETITYGEALPGFTPSYAGFVNGDTGATVTGDAVWTVGGGSSTGGYKVAGSHDVSYASGLGNGLGYSLADAAGSTGELTVNKYHLAVTGLAAQNKVYDATIAAILTGTAAITPLAGDAVTLGGTAGGTFAGKNVGDGQAVTITGNTIAGADAGNYTLIQQAGLTANIARADLAVSGLAAQDKIYDGTTAAILTGTATISPLGDDVVTLGGTAGGTFAGKNVGDGQAVTITGNTISGADAGNYSLIQQTGLTADITPYAVSLTGSRTYDGTVAAAAGDLTLGALVGSETLTLLGTGTVADRHVAAGKAITLGTLALGDGANGGLAANYSFTGGTQTLDITPANLALSTTEVTKTYDGLTIAAGTAIVTAGTLLGTDSLSGGTFAFTDPNAGTNKTVAVSAVTVQDGNGGGNYSVTYVDNTTGTIEKAPLTVTANDVGKTYDGLAYSGGNGVAYAGFVNGETSAVLGGSLGYGGTSQGAINAGRYGIDPTGLAAANYSLSYVSGNLTIKANTQSENVGAAATSGQNGTNGTGQATGGQPGDPHTPALGPGAGSGGIVTPAVLTEPTGGSMVLSTPTYSASVTIRAEGPAVILSIAGATTAGPPVETGALPVFSRSGDAPPALQGNFIVRQSGGTLSLTPAGPAAVEPPLVGAGSGSSAPFTLSLENGLTLQMTATVTPAGVLIVTAPNAAGDVDIRQAVLMGAQVARQVLQVELGTLSSVLFVRQ